jgi:cytochrome c oxidase cbb3-type subunit 2
MLPLRAAGVVAMVYAYFLIFAQFAWVELLRAAGNSPAMETAALGAMALAGIASGFVVARKPVTPVLLRLSLVVAGLTSALSPWAASMPLALGISLLTGAALGAATVALAPLLPRWCGVAWIGAGTGVGYALCNLPPVFTATPSVQAAAGALFAFAGALLVPRQVRSVETSAAPAQGPSMIAAIAAFTALVWLDSAAFFIVQHSADLKSATWGSPLLWRNAGIHLAAGIIAGVALRQGFRGLLVAAWMILAIAALAVNSPDTRLLAGWWYPAGVSLYSTALVAWPGFFGGNSGPRRIAWRAAWLYAVAGWFGSANGIGMAQSLARVPAGFIYSAGAVILVAMFFRREAWRAAAVALGTAAIAIFAPSSSTPKPDAAARGRGVFVAEGCIHCHSRYVRPDSPDAIAWGPPSFTAGVLAEKPVLIGNRRQGPDLANVGLRRSPAWLELHFLEPRSLSPGSRMPSYAHLFRDGRGDDLVAFLLDTDPAAFPQRRMQMESWNPQPGAGLPPAEGLMLFLRHCAVCHGLEGHGDGELASRLSKPPPNLDLGPFVWTPDGPDLETRLARVVKFGIPGTDMPGHETLNDSQVATLAAYLARIRTVSTPGVKEAAGN